MKYQLLISIILILTFTLSSCDRIQNKAEQITAQAINKVFPQFDHDKPDTENNKKRFEDFLKVEITEDIRNIYCFDDAIGIDADYMFAFNCNETTSNKIIEVHNLAIVTLNLDNGFGLQHDFEWWNKERIKDLQKYSWTDENQYFKYYWYDKENQKAYFFDFDM